MTQVIPYHVESAKIGIRLALYHMQGRLPPEDVVVRVLQHPPPNAQLQPCEFPSSVLEKLTDARAARRREYALEALRCIMLRYGDTSLLAESDLNRITAQAWNLSRNMLAEEDTAQQLDTLKVSAP